MAGETVVGSDQRGPAWRIYPGSSFTFPVTEGPTSTLVYNNNLFSFWPCQLLKLELPPERGQRLRMLSWPPQHPAPPADASMKSSHVQFSCAPLENVRRARIFYCGDDGVHCKGLLLEYANGGQRALGQCRLLVDRCETVVAPASVALANVVWWPRLGSASSTTEEPLRAIRVQFDGVHGDSDDDVSWSHFAMAGTLQLWFIHSETVASVSGGRPLAVEQAVRDEDG